MEQRYLADTNLVIDYLENNLPEYANKLVDNIKFQISIISRIELLAWPKATEDQLSILKSFYRYIKGICFR
ncbi:hypothetical protein A0256_19315 [Mucilaginibacter sp. PAMC 26640]|nr:hypothetical protein A0256_19315 [Mucilaginibacter sp. PAMC 26640]